MPVPVTQVGSPVASTTSPVSTASLDFAAGGALIASVAVAVDASFVPEVGALVVTGGGVTWTLVGSVVYAVRRRVWMFKGEGTVADGAITATHTPTDGGTVTGMILSVAQVSNAVTFGTGAVAASDSGTAAVTIPGTRDADTVTVMTVGLEDAVGVAFEAGWVELSDLSETTNVRQLATGWSNLADQSASATFVATGWGTVGVLVDIERPNIAYKSASVAPTNTWTDTSGVEFTLPCPPIVDAGDILIAHVTYLDITTTPPTPSDWTLLYGPANLGTGTAIGRSYVFGKIAAGTEDAAVISFGTGGGTTGRLGAIYSFSGYVGGAITDVVTGFTDTPTEGSIPLPEVTTTVEGALAVALLVQDDNNAFAAAGATGGTWLEPVAEFVAGSIGPQGCVTGIAVCTPTADPGTVTGGTANAVADEGSTIGFQIIPGTAGGSTPVGDTIDARWDVRAAVADTLDGRWAVRSTVADQVDTRWSVRSLAADTLDARWSVLAVAGDNLDTRWSVSASAGDTVELLWDIQSQALTASQELDIRWALKSTVGDSIDTRWSVQIIPVADQLLQVAAGRLARRYAVARLARASDTATIGVTPAGGRLALRYTADDLRSTP